MLQEKCISAQFTSPNETKHSRGKKKADQRDNATDHPCHSSDLVVNVGENVSMAVRTVGACRLVAILGCAHHDRGCRYHHRRRLLSCSCKSTAICHSIIGASFSFLAMTQLSASFSCCFCFLGIIDFSFVHCYMGEGTSWLLTAFRSCSSLSA